MRLSKLELFGFKSFANKTIVNFTNGITGIVGPNGCGKTNIVDAIRWCLGEQKSSTLRSDKMEDVIFNGSRTKKPMGMAEVSLSILNDKGILPTDFTEVTITRRIFRSGESEYLLNKNICRLKDITNLFMDTGMGTNAYSVIELKMVETILSNKADERRKMFEEAAGVNKYKLRRRLSLNKLDDVKKDLNRVNDIVAEVEKNVRSLERQAKKADRYNQILTELREKELNLAEREFFKFNNQLAEFDIDSSILLVEKETIDNNIKEYENNLILSRQRISEIETEFREESSKIAKITEQTFNIRNAISVSEGRLNTLSNNISLFTKNIEEYTFQKDEIEQNITEYTEKLKTLKSLYYQKDDELKNFKENLSQIKSELSYKKDIYKSKYDEFIQLQKNISSIENELLNNKKNIEKGNQALDKLNSSIQTLTSDIAKMVGYLEDLKNEKEQIELKLTQSDNEFKLNSDLKEKLDKEISELRIKELEEKNNIKSILDKIDFLQNLLTNLGGVAKGTKLLIESEGWTSKEKKILADVGNSKDEFRLAIETPLKSILHSLLIESTDDLINAIKYLKKNELGKASFLLNNSFHNNKNLLDKIADFNKARKAKKIQNEVGFINWTSNLIECDNKWKRFFENSLINIALVNSLENAIKLFKKYPDFGFVTIEGDIISKNGVVEAGSSSNLEDSLFGRRQLLENLKNEFPKLESNLHKLHLLIEEKEEESNKINLKSLSERGKILINEITNIDKQIAQIEFEKSKSEKDIERIQNEINEFANQLTFSENRLLSISQDFEQKNNLFSAQKNEIEDFENNLKLEEEDYNKIQDSFNSLQIDLERIKGEIQHFESLIQKSLENKSSLIKSIEKHRIEIENSHSEIAKINSIIEEQKLDYDELLGEKNVYADKLKKIEEILISKKQESAEQEHKLNSIRNQRQNISDKIHSLQIKQNEISIRLENLVQTIQDEYNLQLEKKQFEDIDLYDFAASSKEVHTLKENLKNIGPVNLLAYSEYEEEKERFEFLQKQKDDLIESEKDLIRTIKEINESAQTVFLETFELIKSNFKKIFQSVFNPGDEADLLLEDGTDPLEGKIEIIAKPKGKRPTSIDLLSGGEKTLTATALLFAIYLVKPSPFCIMDEVDAPLDDANVDRFTKLLKDFSDNTQFIIVTHNKRTMEASQNIYGVTIQEEGISKLVGVQFNEQLGVTA